MLDLIPRVIVCLSEMKEQPLLEAKDTVRHHVIPEVRVT